MWLTDYVGILPVGEDDAYERARVQDANRWTLEQQERHPHIRDLSLFVGEPADVVPRRFGEGLPRIDSWTRERYEFCGYIAASGHQSTAQDRSAMRAGLGIGDGERLCVAAVGGSGGGGALLRRSSEAHALVRASHLPLRTIAVCGPRIDPRSIPSMEGLEVRGFEPRLDRLLAAADVAIVQGGLATAMGAHHVA